MSRENLDFLLAKAGVEAIIAIGKISDRKTQELYEMRRKLLEEYYQNMEEEQRKSAKHPRNSAITSVANGAIFGCVAHFFSPEIAKAGSSLAQSVSSGVFGSLERLQEGRITTARGKISLAESEEKTIESTKRLADEIIERIAEAIRRAQEIIRVS